MYVCICRAIREEEVRQAAERGVHELGDLARELGIATGCGRCAESAERVLAQARTRGQLATAR